MGSKYSTVTVSNYNASPPSDDGAQTSSNKAKWSDVKTKLGDPVKTAAEAINTAIVEHVDQGPDTKTANYTTVAGDYNTVIECSGTFTVSLLDAATAGAGYYTIVKNAGSGTITVDTDTVADEIDGAVSYALTPGNSATFIVNAAANGYMKLNVIGTGYEVVETQTASSDPFLEFTLATGYDALFHFQNVYPTTTNQALVYQLKEAGAYLTTSGDYLGEEIQQSGGTVGGATNSTDTFAYVHSQQVGNTAAQGVTGSLEIYSSDTGVPTMTHSHTFARTGGGVTHQRVTDYVRAAAAATTNVKFFFTSNMAGGSIAHWRIKRGV